MGQICDHDVSAAFPEKRERLAWLVGEHNNLISLIATTKGE